MTSSDSTATHDDSPLPACTLVRLTGMASADWTVDDLIDVCARRHVRLVSLAHVGGDGWLKSLDFVPRDAAHLRHVLLHGERADGSSLFGGLGVPVTASDVVLQPRLSTAFLDPFAATPTLVVLCGHLGRDGAPLPQSPDTIVHLAHERLYAEAGIELCALGEVEFFLGKRPDESDIYGAAERGYHASSPFVFGAPLRREALVLLAEIGVPVKYGHSEVGYIQPHESETRIWEQHEVELALTPLPTAADHVVITQWVLRNLAQRRGWRCSFDPVLREGHAGSGLHVHLSPAVSGQPQPVLRDDGALEPHAAWLVGGLVSHAAALMAFGNRVPASFVRLGQAREAPNTVSWGRFNRKALVRLPLVPTDAAGRPVAAPTIEFRLPDGSAHPHLLLAGIAQAMRAAMAVDNAAVIARTSAEAPGASPDAAIRLPRSFADVARELGRHRPMLESGGVFPASVLDAVVQTLDRE